MVLHELTRSLIPEPQVGRHTSLNRAAADLVQFDKWYSAAIERRQEMLAALARKVWGIELAKPEVAG